jgi:hypothetical protein
VCEREGEKMRGVVVRGENFVFVFHCGLIDGAF